MYTFKKQKELCLSIVLVVDPFAFLVVSIEK